MSTTPYTTSSGVQIGCMYQGNSAPHHDQDAIKLQTALLNQTPPLDFDGIAIIVGCAFLMAAPYLLMVAYS